MRQEKLSVKDSVDTGSKHLWQSRNLIATLSICLFIYVFVCKEKSDLVKMNENMSDQISEQLLSIEKLQDHEKDLIQKLDKSESNLELAQNGKIVFYFKMPVHSCGDGCGIINNRFINHNFFKII